MAVIRPDSRDDSKDFFVPMADAQKLYSENKLARDLTNGGYCLPQGKIWPSQELLDLKERFN